MISVIMPCYNQARFMQDALDSIKAQTYKDFEIICVIDGAIDNSQEIADKEADVVVVQENKGVASALNAGLEKAKGEYICVLSQDDMLDPTYFERAIGHDITTSDIEYFGERKEFIKIPALWGKISENNQIHGSSVFKRFGKWNEKAEHYCDWELWIRLQKAGYKLHYIEEPLLKVRTHEGQISNKERPDLDEYIKSTA